LEIKKKPKMKKKSRIALLEDAVISIAKSLQKFEVVAQKFENMYELKKAECLFNTLNILKNVVRGKPGWVSGKLSSELKITKLIDDKNLTDYYRFEFSRGELKFALKFYPYVDTSRLKVEFDNEGSKMDFIYQKAKLIINDDFSMECDIIKSSDDCWLLFGEVLKSPFIVGLNTVTLDIDIQYYTLLK
jgi:hypothetical protein